MASLLIGTGSIAVAAEPDFAFRQITSYPFVATPKRAATVTRNFDKIANGMTPGEVKAVLGEPDEVRPLYGPRIKSAAGPQRIGHTYWYVLRRARETGSVDEKDESLVRVTFGNDGAVIEVVRW